MPVPNTFANATTSIPLSQLDANFATAITLGNTSIQLGNTVTTLNNMTFANVTVSSGSVTVANVTVTGVGTFAAGSNTAPSITTSGDTNTGVFFPAADTVATTTGGTERMRVDSSGNVGIGTSSPARRFEVLATGTNIPARLGNSQGNLDIGGSNGTTVDIDTRSWAMGLQTGGLERMRIDASGNVGIGTSSGAGKIQVVLGTSYTPGAGWSTSTAVFGGSTNISGAFGIAYDDTNGAALASILPGTAWKPIYTNCSDFIVKTNGTTEAMRVNSSGNVGIGTSSPGQRLTVYSASGDNRIRMQSAGSVNTGIEMISTAGTGYFDYNNQNFTWTTGGSERARIDSSGDLLVGTTSGASTRINVAPAVNQSGITITQAGAGDYCFKQIASNNGGTYYFQYFGAGATAVGSITSNGSTTSYNTSSDYRLKNNVQPMQSGLAKIGLLKPVTYDWKADGSVGEGFIAHELQDVIPLAVTGEKDAVNADGSIKSQGVDYSKIVVHLVAAIQELKADFDAYKATHP